MRVIEAGDVGGADFVEFDIVFRVADSIEPGRKLQQIDLQRVTLPFVGRVLLGVEGGELLEIEQFLIGQQLSAACAGQANQNEGQSEAFHAGVQL